MAIIGISILLASISYILYRSQTSTWWHTCAQYISRGEQRKVQAGEKAAGGADIQIGNSKSTINQALSEKRTSGDTSTERKEEEDEDINTTPTATKPSSPLDEVAQTLPTVEHDLPPIPKSVPVLATPEKTPTTATPAMSTLMPPPPRPQPQSQLRPTPSSTQTTRPPTSSSLLVPPRGPVPSRPLPSGRSSLAPPPSAASTLRRPPTTSSAASTSTLPAPARPRKKVILAPGHSPIDWAELVRTTPNLSGIPTNPNNHGRMLRISPAQLALHNGRKGAPAWSAWQGKVYNVGPYLPYHPGGEGELRRAAGKGGEVVKKMFMEAHPWVNWEGMLGGCLVGVMVGEGEGDELVVEGKGGKGGDGVVKEETSELDEMD